MSDVKTLQSDGIPLIIKDQTARNIIATPYDPTSGTYGAGDVCINGNQGYKALVDISTPEAFDPTKWEPTTLGELYTELKSNLTELNNYVTATLPNSATDINVNYPSGYTYDNCYVVAILVKDNQNIWRVGEGMASGSERLFIQMKENYMDVLNNDPGFYSRPIRIVLQKLGSDITPT